MAVWGSQIQCNDCDMIIHCLQVLKLESASTVGLWLTASETRLNLTGTRLSLFTSFHLFPNDPGRLKLVHEKSTHGVFCVILRLLSLPCLAQMEEVIARMQDEKNGIPIRTVKSFLTKIPSVFSGKLLRSEFICPL